MLLCQDRMVLTTSTAIQDGNLSLSLDRQCITETENRDRLHVDWSMSASGLPLFDKTVPQSFKALLVLRFRFAEQQTAVALE